MPSCMPASSKASLLVSYTTISVAEMMELRSRLGKYLLSTHTGIRRIKGSSR